MVEKDDTRSGVDGDAAGVLAVKVHRPKGGRPDTATFNLALSRLLLHVLDVYELPADGVDAKLALDVFVLREMVTHSEKK